MRRFLTWLGFCRGGIVPSSEKLYEALRQDVELRALIQKHVRASLPELVVCTGCGCLVARSMTAEEDEVVHSHINVQVLADNKTFWEHIGDKKIVTKNFCKHCRKPKTGGKVR